MARFTTRRPGWQWTTLIVSLALAASLGATLYYATSSLPFLATSPSTDPTFGVLNACLHAAVPSRTGFTVSDDARAAAVWSTNTVARCALDTDGTKLSTWPVTGVTVGAFTNDGTLWVVSQPGGLTSTLLRLTDTGSTALTETGAIDLASRGAGVLVLESGDRLVALDASGAVASTTNVPTTPSARLAVSFDGQRVAITGTGALLVFDSTTLAPMRAEVPCDVDALWWLPNSHHVLLSCRSDVLLRVDTDTGTHDVAQPPRPPASRLLGTASLYVEPCDVLPCTSEGPR